MSMTFSQIQDFVRFRIGNRTDLSSGIGLTNLNLWINTSMHLLNHQFRFPTSTAETTLTATANQRYISIPSTSTIFAILSVYDTTNSRQLDPFEGDFALYERQFPVTYSQSTRWLREASSLYLTPGPDSADSFRCLTWNEVPDLVGANDLPPFPIPWHKALAILSTVEAWHGLDDDERAAALLQGEYAPYVSSLRTPRAIESHNTRRRGIKVNRSIRDPRMGV